MAILACAAVAGSVIGMSVYLAQRPQMYVSGEDHDAITRRLELKIPDSAPTPRFEDVTEVSGLSGFRSFAGERTSQLPEDMGSGAAWGDFDDDGDDDLFIVSSGGALGLPESELERSQLYVNRGDGTFTVAKDFPETRVHGMGVAWGDYDGDGWLDLVVTGYDCLRLFHNTRDGFERESSFEDRQGFWAGASWADFDRDGDLDLYVTGYVRYDSIRREKPATQQYGSEVPYTLNPASFEPQANLLFRNDGSGGFDDIAEALGVDNPAGRSLGAIWNDFDENGWPDLYVANDISDNALFLNKEGQFEDAGLESWVADYRGAMGLATADWDRDGDDDLFVTHWMAQENALYQSTWGNLTGEKQLRFMDVADQQGLGQIALQRVGWGAEFTDFDSDGWLDLVVVNGSTFETEELPKRLRRQEDFLFWSRAGKVFHDLAGLVPVLTTPRVSRGLAVSDYDLDGDVDLLIVDLDGGVRLLENQTPQGNWIEITLRRTGSNPIRTVVEGARVTLTLDDGTALRQSVTGASYLSHSSRTMHFGLGVAERIRRVEIVWPDGLHDFYEGPEVNARWEVAQGEAAPRRRVEPTAVVSEFSSERERVSEFWRRQRAAMNAMKVDDDLEGAIALFHGALELDPTHQDSLYYLANCLVATGDTDGALARFAQVVQINPLSHRALKSWGSLRATTSATRGELDEALVALERALSINTEETGVLQALAEVELLGGHERAAHGRLEMLLRANPHSRGGLFMLAYLSWKRGEGLYAKDLLQRAVEANSEDWKPSGAAAEGDVRNKMHQDLTPLSGFVAGWDGTTDPDTVFAPLATYLKRLAASM